MASSFYSNTQHIDFASVLAMNDPDAFFKVIQQTVGFQQMATVNFNQPVILDDSKTMSLE
ncbi:hypothetical protein F511_36406 [Dorcoceras hygrometricum]|uniref:Uncharacterized protein n=1 Tax=Dorcoceras hygrometricum TaxID=472368 RepID=A0A2Z7BBD0_9LAMI|nr:hypothetical protein F511_36406 [Dorcoceras hygrometricum]